jgi:RNA polymerase sigma-70 factor (ECF subfamily)
MEPAEREAFEKDVRERCGQGAHDRAAEAVIRGYGPEVLAFLAAQHRRDEDADDVFAVWSERVYRGLPAFAWECSLRTWVYVLARNASRTFLRDAQRRGRREVPMDPDASVASRVAYAVRTATRPYLQTEVKDKLAEIRESLPEEDRALLVLRLDRGLAWNELARVMLEGEGEGAKPAAEPVTDAVLKRESARLRKRFQFVKERILELGREAGLLDATDEDAG